MVERHFRLFLMLACVGQTDLDQSACISRAQRSFISPEINGYTSLNPERKRTVLKSYWLRKSELERYHYHWLFYSAIHQAFRILVSSYEVPIVGLQGLGCLFPANS